MSEYSIPSAEMIDCLADNFKVRFSEFRSHVINILVFEKPFSVKISYVPKGKIWRLNCSKTQF